MDSINQNIILENLETLVLNHLPIRTFWKNRDSVYLGSNLLFAQDAGFGHPSELVGKTDYDFPWCDTEADLYRKDDKEVMESGVPKLNYEEHQLKGQGSTWLRTSKIPLLSQAGEVIGVLGTYEDITERKLIELELVKLQQTAEASNQSKTEFMCRMSHDLRTPLHAILGNVEMLEMGGNLTSAQLHGLSVIKESGEDLSELISGILEMGQIENGGNTKVRLETCNLFHLLQRILQQHAEIAQERNVMLHLEPDFRLPETIETDSLMFRRILGNLLGNAIKFTNEGDKVSVSAERHGDGIMISVIDTGPGIEPEKIEQIFAPFVQANGLTSKDHGIGLGLSIAKTFAEKLGGKITVDSTIGEGSCFSLWLPLKRKAAAVNPTKDEASENSDFRGVRMLVVDDQPANRDLLSRYLQRKGATVETAVNGEEALDKNSSFLPAVILMDIRMPVLDGLEATRRIRAKSSNQSPKIIAITGEALDEVSEDARKAGCDDYLTKPVPLNLLTSSIKLLLSRN